MISFNNVSKSYNGKSGCMCGCNGKYKLPCVDAIPAANKEVGYEAYDESDVSPRSIKLAINKINKALANKDELTSQGVDVGLEAGEHAWVDDGSRITVVYLK